MTHTAPDFERATARELAEWPGVSWAFERLAKHRAERKRVRRPRVEPERSIKPTERLSGASPARDPWAALRESMG